MRLGNHADGRELEFDTATKSFDLGGQAVAPDEVLRWDTDSLIQWQNEDLRSWARSFASGTPVAAAPGELGPGNAATESSSNLPGNGWFSRLSLGAQVAFVLFYPVSLAYGAWAAVAKGGRYRDLPPWAKPLFVIFYPASIAYGVWVIWKDRRYTPAVRVMLTAAAGLFAAYFIGTIIWVSVGPCANPPAAPAAPPGRSASTTATAAPESASGTPTATGLPPHTVASDTDISFGGVTRRRIEIHVTDPKLSKDDAIALIQAYIGRAGDEGQVSVRKPDPSGVLQPWAVDNMDGQGVTFNDELFVAQPAPAPKPKPTSSAEKHYNLSDKYYTADIMTAWTREQIDAAFRKDGGRAVSEVWPMGKDQTWVEIKYKFPDKSWLFVGFSEDVENIGGGESTWRMTEVFPPGEAR